MTPRIFVSYSSPDQLKAEAIRQALEDAGIVCWIAPRDLQAGTQWGAGIVQAIKACEAVVVVFSQAANNSPQVAREMELAVANRRPLIPIRVANDMPTDDMQYFLGVSHWFNAYAQPIETYLPDITTAVKGVLARERNPWANMMRRMPKSRGGQIAAAAAALAAAVVVLGLMMRPPNPMDAMNSPLAGRWEAKLPNGSGGTVQCVLDVPKQGMATYGDSCPDPLTSATGLLNVAKSSVFAPNLFKGGDTGSFMFQNTVGGANLVGAYHLGFFGLTTRDARFGDVKWKHAGSGDAPVARAANGVLDPTAAWPLQNVPDVVGRANAYVHSKWQPDAVLMSVDLKGNPSGAIDASFNYYSPSKQQGVSLQPNSQGSVLSSPVAEQQDVSQAIPAQFLDLPDAISKAQSSGMQGKQISEAQLEWSGGDSCGTGNFAIDNAILPKCQPGRFIGFQWLITSALNERKYIPAV
jgi:hypothetical protein